MLIYHPAQDVNHAVYRLLLILNRAEQKELQVDLFRLIDFYTLFPHLLKKISPMPLAISRHKKIFSDITEPFESLKNIKRIFNELELLQSVAIQNLTAKGILDKGKFDEGILRLNQKALPDNLVSALQNAGLLNDEWFGVIVDGFPKINFKGRNGLKARTGLMEYRYDMEES